LGRASALKSGEVGGVQNTVTNLGASIGTALAGAVLISALTTSFLTGVAHNPNVPQDVASKAQLELAGRIPFLSDKDLQAQLDKAGVPQGSRRDRHRKRKRPHRRALLVTGATRHHRADRPVRHPPHPRPAAHREPRKRAHSPDRRALKGPAWCGWTR